MRRQRPQGPEGLSRSLLESPAPGQVRDHGSDRAEGGLASASAGRPQEAEVFQDQAQGQLVLEASPAGAGRALEEDQARAALARDLRQEGLSPGPEPLQLARASEAARREREPRRGEPRPEVLPRDAAQGFEGVLDRDGALVGVGAEQDHHEGREVEGQPRGQLRHRRT